MNVCKTLNVRTINTKTSGSSIVERFQDEITGKVAVIVKKYLNRFVLLCCRNFAISKSNFRAISKVDSGFFF